MRRFQASNPYLRDATTIADFGDPVSGGATYDAPADKNETKRFKDKHKVVN